MKFQEAEVVEIGKAEDLVQIAAMVVTNLENLEYPQTSKDWQAVYISDAE